MRQVPMATPALSDLGRLALTPRFLVRAVLALLLILAFVLLGRWQWREGQPVRNTQTQALRSQALARRISGCAAADRLAHILVAALCVTGSACSSCPSRYHHHPCNNYRAPRITAKR